MNEPEHHDNAVRDVLHHAVDHIYSSPNLADRIENAAKRRRANRRSVIGAAAMVIAVAATGVLVSGRDGGRRDVSTTGSATVVKTPACAAKLPQLHRPASSLAHPATGPVVPGAPVAAAVCRYGRGGNLAASDTVTQQTQLSRLLTAMNASRPYAGSLYCAMDDGSGAVVVFAYAQNTRELTVVYNRACVSLYTDTGAYFANAGVDTLITAWTGDWHSEANPSSS